MNNYYDKWHCYVAEIQQWITQWTPAGSVPPDTVSLVDRAGTVQDQPVLFRHAATGCRGHGVND